MVIVELTRGLPYVYGERNGVHVSEVDYINRGRPPTCAELPNPPPRDRPRRSAPGSRRRSRMALAFSGHWRHAQRGLHLLLLESGVRDLGVHTEMLTDGIGELYQQAGFRAPGGSGPRQGRLTLRARFEQSVRRDAPQSRLPLLSG